MTDTGSNHQNDTAQIVAQMRLRARDGRDGVSQPAVTVPAVDDGFRKAFGDLKNRVEALEAQPSLPHAANDPNAVPGALHDLLNRIDRLENEPKDITPRTDADTTNKLNDLLNKVSELFKRVLKLESEPKNDGSVNARSSDDIAALESRIDNLADILGENSAASLNNASLVLKELQSLRDRVNAMEGKNHNIKAEILTMLMQEYASMQAELQRG
jgi:uncharacterized protein (UPF0335 family)